MFQHKRLLISLPLLLLTTTSFAENNWQFAITPYLWNIDLNGTVQLRTKKTHVSQKKLGGMVTLETKYKTYGAFANVIYSEMTGTRRYGGFNIKATNKYSIVTAAASVEMYHQPLRLSLENEFIVEPYVGARFTLKTSMLKATSMFFNYSTSHDVNWTDPIIGFKFNLTLDKAWHLFFSGDIGGTSTERQYSYNTMALIGYQPQNSLRHFTLYGGYQILDQHYVEGSGSDYFNWNVKLSGPMLGVKVNF